MHLFQNISKIFEILKYFKNFKILKYFKNFKHFKKFWTPIGLAIEVPRGGDRLGGRKSLRFQRRNPRLLDILCVLEQIRPGLLECLEYCLPAASRCAGPPACVRTCRCSRKALQNQIGAGTGAQFPFPAGKGPGWSRGAYPTLTPPCSDLFY